MIGTRTRTRIDRPLPCAHIVAALQGHALERGDKIALIEHADGEQETARLTYAELVGKVRGLSSMMTARGWRGEPVIIAAKPGLDYVVAVLACMFAGAIAVPMPEYQARSSPRWQAVLDQLKPVAIFVPDRVSTGGCNPEGPALLSAAMGSSDHDAEHAPVVSDHAIAFLQFTSGSTGAPKGAVIRQAALSATRTMMRDALDQDADWCCVTWLPPWHDLGLVGGLLQPLGEGMQVVVLPPMAVIQRPIRWLRAIAHYRAIASGGPSFAYAACVERIAAADRAALDLSSWRLAYCGAEPVRGAVLTAFAEAFRPNGFAGEALYPCYGLAEATLFVTGPGRGEGMKELSVDPAGLRVGAEAVPSLQGRSLVSCGSPWSGGGILISDPESGLALPAGRVGEVCVTGPHLAAGYWGRDEELDATFVEVQGTRHLRTGDLGFVHDGELFVIGRIKDVLIVRGTKHHAEDIEDIARSTHPLLANGVAAAFALDDGRTETAVLVIEASRDAITQADNMLNGIAGAVLRSCGIRLGALAIVRPGVIPRTTSGKVERYRMRERFIQGLPTPAVIAAMGSHAITEAAGSLA